MARTQTVSDETIFEAAGNVIQRRGVQGFTLTDVASEVGLSRAAIILRFKSTQALKVALMTRMVDEFIRLMSELPQARGGDSLLEVAAFIGRRIENRIALPSFLASYPVNMEEQELAVLERKRGASLRQAIVNVMPDTRIDREAAAAVFNAHLTGTIMNWISVDETDSVAFIVDRTKDWLRMAGISFSEGFNGRVDADSDTGKNTLKPVKQK